MSLFDEINAAVNEMKNNRSVHWWSTLSPATLDVLKGEASIEGLEDRAEELVRSMDDATFTITAPAETTDPVAE